MKVKSAIQKQHYKIDTIKLREVIPKLKTIDRQPSYRVLNWGQLESHSYLTQSFDSSTAPVFL